MTAQDNLLQAAKAVLESRNLWSNGITVVAALTLDRLAVACREVESENQQSE